MEPGTGICAKPDYITGILWYLGGNEHDIGKRGVSRPIGDGQLITLLT